MATGTEKNVGELDDYYVTTEEMKLFEQLISSDLALSSSAGAKSPDQEEYYESDECFNRLMVSDYTGVIEAPLFPEVNENKDQSPPGGPSSGIKHEKAEITQGHSPTQRQEHTKSNEVSVKSESDDGSEASFYPWICRICKKTFKHQYTLSRHLPTHTGERNFRCDTCGKGFRQLSTLTQHRAIHTNARPYVCPTCRKTFNRISTLISHKKTHTHDKPHKCNMCGKAFHQKGNLRNHVFTHTNERPYKCNLCGKGFNQKSNLVCHKMHYHARNKTFQCRQCMLLFNNRNSLSFHEEIVHGIPPKRPQRRDPLSPCGDISDPKMNELQLTIDEINTSLMRETLRKKRTPLALLQTHNARATPVKLAPAENRRLLILPIASHEVVQYSECGPNKIRFKMPMVAKIMQTFDENGHLQLKVEPILENFTDNLNKNADGCEQNDAKLLTLN